MTRNEKFVLWFEEVGKEDVALVGGKCANLGELMTKARVPVPPGFAVTTYAFNYFITRTKVRDKIFKKLEEIDVRDLKQLEEASREIRRLIEEARIPEEIETDILKAYDELARKVGREPLVAVRSSASAED